VALGGIGPNLSALGLGGTPGIGPATSGAAKPAEGAGGFSQILASLSGSSANADDAVSKLATGQDNDLHDVMLSVESEGLAFDLAVQIRNRLVDAYSEIFRMQV
jgi:flagellar hook-basal body complex protein FliE